MTRRPLAVLCVICVIIIAALTAFGLPPDRGRSDKNAVLKTLEVPRSVSVTGEVKSSRELDDYSFFVLEQAVLSVNSSHYKINNVRVTQSIPSHYAVGMKLRVNGVCRCIESASNPGQFDRKCKR